MCTVDGTRIHRTQIGFRLITDENVTETTNVCERVKLFLCLALTFCRYISSLPPFYLIPHYVVFFPTPVRTPLTVPRTFLSSLRLFTAALLRACRTELASVGRLCADRLVLCRSCRCNRGKGYFQDLCPV